MSASFVLRQAMVLDEEGGFSGPRDIQVVDGLVTRIGQDLRADGESYDFAGLWVMPGMVDCHLHAIATSLDTMELLRMPLSQRVLEAASMLRRTLEAGVTLARDASGIDAGIRNAVQRGYVPGPHLQIAFGALSESGGHYDGYLHGLAVPMTTGYQVPDYPGRPPLVVDGPDEIRKAVRLLVRAGVDWIKLCTTGGIVSGTGAASQFTRDEIFLAVSEAHRRGKPAMVHCYGGEGLRHSVEAGVRSIDHGVMMTEEDAALMKEKGCWLVPTVTIQQDIKRWASAGKLGPAAAGKVAEIEPFFGRSVKLARAAGVKIALGTDFISREQHGTNLREIAAVVDAGLTVEEALLAATRNGAELLSLAKDHGQIAPGFLFDAIVLDDDPSDLSFARSGNVGGVFQRGEAIVPHPRLGQRVSASSRTPVGVER
ncbi:MAG TPA: amidohydrolase family protein [Candidatus Dormibacteraeota bacterium]